MKAIAVSMAFFKRSRISFFKLLEDAFLTQNPKEVSPF
ncbi:MAG: hypothetical protein BSOLF_2672 [Candidatus Carbobacillus altaicus]|uniref:Uncharacterized protein n=1 Tax=Candidatus Carbonibacillus altaicus TaxID=2163959 RepID=A0A2R6Y276_9BACL|nr:MAG: hypothetical protein BSOLF_2672 [Candidatus Carbobacillus altaicus]